MKKLFSSIVTGILFSSAVCAQSSESTIGSIPAIIQAYTGSSTAVNILGKWNFAGSAVNLGSDEILSSAAGNAVSSGMEAKIDDYLHEVGINDGSVTFVFNDDLTFLCTVKGISMEGKWRTLDEGERVQLQFGKQLKYLSMTGMLQGNATECRMLFEEKRFLLFIKSVLAHSSDQNKPANRLDNLAGNFKNMKIGWVLKQN
ncbi:MAG: DUF4923 family protein [Bacteroidales bacterium]|nr:DUF4923 family protein [Bacteroidales bacterium]